MVRQVVHAVVVAPPEHPEQLPGLAVEVDRIVLDPGLAQQRDELGLDRLVAPAVFLLPAGVEPHPERVFLHRHASLTRVAFR